LRTPVALARTTAELSLRKHRSEEEYREALRQILAELERTTDLIEDLMTLARTDAGAVSLQISKVDLVPTIQEVCSRSQVLAETKQLHFRQRIPDANMFIHGDTQVLRRLFLILIDNAIKYTPPGGEVALSLNRENGYAIGEISDSGIGIAPADLAHIFERFYRADRARSRDSGGTGLGLSIAQWIAAVHGASIEVESSLGKGSLFRVRIPTVGS
jgi:signal transduction histidine kinase